jgi:hypothetical protein
MAQHNSQPGKGVLFTQKDKKNDRAPDLRGQMMLLEDAKAGDIIKISAWKRVTAMGDLISLSQDTWKPDRNQTQYPVEVNSGKNEDEVPW